MDNSKIIELITNVAEKAHWNLTPDQLIEKALERGEGKLTDTGALAADTGEFTGRSPKDKFLVEDSNTKDTVWWGEINQPFAPEKFDALLERLLKHYEGKEVFIRDAYACADPLYRLNIKVVNESAYQNLFANNLFLRPTQEEIDNAPSDWIILAAPSFMAVADRDGTRQHNFSIINMTQKIILIGGSGYTGEIKKGIFSVLNYILPQERNVLSMHCSANIGQSGDTAIFFGLSGTGKTTLSADPTCSLIGDDEHGWGEGSVFNFEGGCYAKTIDLSEENEPVIFNAIKHGSVIENVFLDNEGNPDYYNTSLSENGRCCYPRSHIENAIPSNSAGEAETVIFLTCDLTGLIPPVSILSKEAAAYHFLSGYTAKVGSTEMGSSSSIESTFSTCFGAPFFPRPAGEYADLLMKRVESFGSKVYLVNTGWTGGPFGKGSRFSIPTTRRVVNAIQNGELNGVPTRFVPGLNLEVPVAVNGVDAKLLNPIETWDDKEEYKEYLQELVKKFQDNFEKFKVNSEIVSAGPKL